ncbi:hypothetical protein EVAR_10049_1 [Eumeta japonica]|uniref:Kazal-like domain-containing protein n=1 Tax=Eumeta variegata TaxID=151549 RepID=A0A4C1TRF4_EUMVA|nr:hypothetical protein EVAR_10049_1 [Eumeta japonica]
MTTNDPLKNKTYVARRTLPRNCLRFRRPYRYREKRRLPRDRKLRRPPPARHRRRKRRRSTKSCRWPSASAPFCVNSAVLAKMYRRRKRGRKRDTREIRRVRDVKLQLVLELMLVALLACLSAARARVACLCPAVYAPVCASDGRVYENKCKMKCSSIRSLSRRMISVKHSGPCA